jgi:3-methylcrotonyl-CoA carboxylase alpha subunit
MFNKILIANRGEIACRVIETARRLGVRTVAVYSDADRHARHVAMADQAVHIGPAPARESYLVADRLVAAAKASGAQGVHPGYGFLSENAGFAEACAAAGITFIGPTPSAIRAMGSKSEAKKLMEAAKVPLVPGYHGDDQSPALLAREAERIGYPVLIKAAAGGGGKGMRIVERAGKFAEALAGAQREAKAAFADDHVLVEKYLTRPRHIEVQVFGDTHGNYVYLFERDCSIQRRHQKVVEEAPAPGMTAERRRAMGEAAVAAARAIGYVGAGTVEFIADESGAFFFMEMNTRLQVEHPVTEMITGQDLVEWQLRVATGEKLPLTQAQLAIDGHAFEVRLYAEDPSRNFLPSVGTLTHLSLPARAQGVRVDTGVRQGDVVSPHYDPMIAKIIVHDRDRASALRRLRLALAETEVVGVRTNTALLARIAAHPAFAAGEVDTGFIERHKEAVIPKIEPADERSLALASLARLLEWRTAAAAAAAATSEPTSPWHRVDGWRLNGAGHDEIRWKAGDGEVAVVVHYRRVAGSGVPASHDAVDCQLQIGETRLDASAVPVRDGGFRATLGQTVTWARVVRHAANDGGVDYVVFSDGDAGGRPLRLIDPRDVTAAEAGVAHGAGLKAPMPGKIIDIKVKDGETVARGQAVIVLEAMKMEHTLVAPSDGTIKRLLCAPGDQVQDGAELVDFAAAEA